MCTHLQCELAYHSFKACVHTYSVNSHDAVLKHEVQNLAALEPKLRDHTLSQAESDKSPKSNWLEKKKSLSPE